jgi:hypothetical protein
MDLLKLEYRPGSEDQYKGADHRMLTKDECLFTIPPSDSLVSPNCSDEYHRGNQNTTVKIMGYMHITPPSRFTKEEIDNTLLYFFAKQNHEIVDE